MNKKKVLMRNGMPAVEGSATRFWNVVSKTEGEGEIELYGDIVSRKPINYWTGEEIPGDFITPQGFREDLEAVKDKAHITVRLNSCGGDLYTGIAIHNALKELKGDINVIVEGIAASAASVIMCAGDKVSVYPGSLVMIHGVSMLLMDYMNLQDLKKLVRAAESSESAVAAIYNRKTGISTDTLRSMMERETWMTGEEALEKGFANEILESEQSACFSMSADKKRLFVNGVAFSTEGIRNLPGSIPVSDMAIGPEGSCSRGETKNKKEEHLAMTLEELRTSEPDLVAEIENSAKAAAKAETDASIQAAVQAEQARIREIDEIAPAIADGALVASAKYGENACDAKELAFRALQADAKLGKQVLNQMIQDSAASGANDVAPAPNAGFDDEDAKAETDQKDMKAVVSAYLNSKKRG